MIADGRLRFLAGSVTALVLSTLVLAGCGSDGAPPGPRELGNLWEEGRSFSAFMESVEAREETWRRNRERAVVPEDLLSRARAAGGSWRLLVIADDWCGDSAHTVPYVARLAASLEGLEMRIVASDDARPLMRAHPTPDGRAATPTMVLLDEEFHERGCFVERPPRLQSWFLENPGNLPRARLLDEKYARYEADAGRSTLEEIVAVLEAAGRGEVRCPAPASPGVEDPA